MAEPAETRLSDLLRTARARLSRRGLEDPGLESRILIEALTGLGRTEAIAHPERAIPAVTVALVMDALARRERGEPVYRILGARDFHGLRLRLSPGTLEPRPDTEALVEAMIPFVRERAERTGRCRILDLGTGTGAIALALLSAQEAATAIGVDLSQDAVATALRNAEENGLRSRFAAMVSDWFAAVSGRYDAIVSNPPYIRSDLIGDLDAEVRDHDPHLALDGGADGLEAYRRISAECGRFLASAGRVGVEIGYDQKPAVTEIFAEAGFAVVEAHEDLAGRDRALIFAAQDTI